MFKFFAIVFAAILAVAVAAPKPGVLATAPLAYSAYSAPLAYSAGYTPYAATYATYGAAPLAYSGYGIRSYAYPTAYSAPLVHY